MGEMCRLFKGRICAAEDERVLVITEMVRQ
jgi:hypothetical protein